MLADMPVVLFAWKAVAGAAVLGMFFLRRNQGKETSIGVLPGLAAIILADLAAVWSFLPGIILLLLGHILLAVSFLRKKPISRASWAQWFVLSLLVAGLVILVSFPEMDSLGWGAAICAPVFLLMAYCTDGQSLRTRYAAGFLLTSDLLLGAYLFVWNEPLAHFLHIALHSISLMLLALGKKSEY